MDTEEKIRGWGKSDVDDGKSVELKGNYASKREVEKEKRKCGIQRLFLG